MSRASDLDVKSRECSFKTMFNTKTKYVGDVKCPCEKRKLDKLQESKGILNVTCVSAFAQQNINLMAMSDASLPFENNTLICSTLIENHPNTTGHQLTNDDFTELKKRLVVTMNSYVKI